MSQFQVKLIRTEKKNQFFTTAEILWTQSLPSELHVPTLAPVLLCDNLSSLIISPPYSSFKNKAYMVCGLFFVREEVLSKRLAVYHIPAQDQLVDLLTKPQSTS